MASQNVAMEILAQYMTMQLAGGEPPLSDDWTTSLQGQSVQQPEPAGNMTGVVVGPSAVVGWVWVRWDIGHIGLHPERGLRQPV